MKNILMIYSIPEGDDITRIAFNRKLFSYNVQTHSGRYKRKSNGILSIYQKPVRSCVIFEDKHLNNVKKLCKSLKIKSVFYQIKEV
jgi:hypothetical protein